MTYAETRDVAMAETLAAIDDVTSECLGCGELIPADSLSDLFCAKVKHRSWCPPAARINDMGCRCEPDLDSCQYTALERIVDDPTVGRSDWREWHGYLDDEARWRPEPCEGTGMPEATVRPSLGDEFSDHYRQRWVTGMGHIQPCNLADDPVDMGYVVRRSGCNLMPNLEGEAHTHVLAGSVAANLVPSGVCWVSEGVLGLTDNGRELIRDRNRRTQVSMPARITWQQHSEPSSHFHGEATVYVVPSVADACAPTMAELNTGIPIGRITNDVMNGFRVDMFRRHTLDEWAITEPELSPRERALLARQNRNTGPAPRRQRVRRIDPRGTR